MSSVYVAHAKHGTFTYHSALSIVRERFLEGWYDGTARARAEAALSSLDEQRAWRFLQSRKEHEYEYVEKQLVK